MVQRGCMDFTKATTRVLGFWIVVGDRGPYATLGDARSSPHPSVVALGCLDGRDERGDRVATKPLVNNSESAHKGQVLLSGVKEGRG
jgi:hypothetical protein